LQLRAGGRSGGLRGVSGTLSADAVAVRRRDALLKGGDVAHLAHGCSCDGLAHPGHGGGGQVS
jgi:hypothetical protein